MRSPLLARLLALALAAALPAGAAAQTTLGSVTGVVRDSDGLVLPGVTVTLVNEATGARQETVSSGIGSFTFPQLPAGTYRATLALQGFQTRTYSGVVVNVGQTYSLSADLGVGALTETLTVVAGESLVQVSTPEISSTVGQRQVLDIPLAGRDITNLIKLQAGVAGISNRANTVINGGRPTWTQVTVDGINVQDNFIRVNGLDFLPNRPTSDNVAEFTISTAVVGAETAGGATTVRMVTPSGSNTLRGSVYEFNRDSKFAANSFFNNASGVEKAKLKRNQFGGRAGGPILRDKLFFFGYYEAFRQRSQTAQNVTIPANADFYNGVFRYVALDGQVRSVNVMQLSGLPVDQKLRADFLSKFPDASKVNNFLVGNSSAGRVLNTAGYRFNQTDLNQRNQFDLRFDFNATPNQQFEAVYSYYNDTDDRTDIDLISPDRPLVIVESAARRFVGAWRSTWSGAFQNELRGGGNLSPVSFTSNWDHGAGVLYNTVLSLTNPVGGNGTAASFQSQGRNTDTYQLSNSANWLKGRHQIQLGGSWQRNDVNPYNFGGQFPVVTFGFSTAAPPSVQLASTMFPGGISAADLANANAMTAFLGGVVTSVQQTYQVRDTSSGFVAGIPQVDFYTLDNYAAYVQDNWQWKPNFTVRAGLKWEYYAPIREDRNIGFVPVTGGRPIDQVMRDPAATISFVNGGFYEKDTNNFGPTAGFAWDLTNDGKTVVRGGYSLTFVNEDTVTVARNVARGNSGLTTTVNRTGLYATVNGGVPLPTTPAFLSTRTLADQMALSSSAVLWGLDPEIVSPHVHQVSIGIQREVLRGTAVEARYVGTFGREIWRGTDLNQMQLSPAFLADFERARRNGYLAQAAGLGFNPAFNQAVAGSEQLTVLPAFGTALLTNATVVNRLQTNQPGGLVDFFITQRVPGSMAFLPNQGIYAANLIHNGAFSDYNSLQFEARRQVSRGFFAQANYTWSHTNTDSLGTGQNRFEAFMDNNRPELSTGRSFFHQTHVLNANAIYQLPFGEGQRWVNRGGVLNGIVGNWQIAGILALQSGSPMTIFSGRGTINRIGRSDCSSGGGLACNTAVTSLTVDQIRDKLGVFTGPDGRLYWIDPSVVDPGTGRAVGADNLTNAPGFPGQIFFNAGGSEVGSLPVHAFDGPRQFRLDLALSKRIRFGGRYGIELKAEAFNVTNSPSFFLGDRDINSTTFGRITSVNVGSRVVQWSGRFDF